MNRVFATGSRRDSRKGKGRYDLISPIALRLLALVCEEGAENYGERNWELGQPLSWYLDSAIRHLQRALAGDTSEDHVAKAKWNCMAFLHTREMIRAGRLPAELDDLPKGMADAFVNAGVGSGAGSGVLAMAAPLGCGGVADAGGTVNGGGVRDKDAVALRGGAGDA